MSLRAKMSYCLSNSHWLLLARWHSCIGGYFTFVHSITKSSTHLISWSHGFLSLSTHDRKKMHVSLLFFLFMAPGLSSSFLLPSCSIDLHFIFVSSFRLAIVELGSRARAATVAIAELYCQAPIVLTRNFHTM